jgi:hypothetical protein
MIHTLHDVTVRTPTRVFDFFRLVQIFSFGAFVGFQPVTFGIQIKSWMKWCLGNLLHVVWNCGNQNSKTSPLFDSRSAVCC